MGGEIGSSEGEAVTGRQGMWLGPIVCEDTPPRHPTDTSGR